MKKILFISWGNYLQGKESIANYFGVRSIYIGKKQDNRIASIISYPLKIIRTIITVWQEDPYGIIVTNTMWLLPAICIIIGKILNIKIIFHTHTCGIVNSQYAYPNFLKHLFVKIASQNYVSNENHKKIVEKWGGKATVLPDPPIDFSESNEEKYILSNNVNICYINNYMSDEPYKEVIDAFLDLKEITLYITGNPRNKIIIDYPNIIHTGYLTRSKYIFLIKHCEVLMVLTKQEDTFQCGANEALSLGKPLITSNTRYLKSYFTKGTVFVDINPSSIKEGIVRILDNIEKYSHEMRTLREEKIEYFNRSRIEYKNQMISSK